jgi:hypothetical protein
MWKIGEGREVVIGGGGGEEGRGRELAKSGGKMERR